MQIIQKKRIIKIPGGLSGSKKKQDDTADILARTYARPSSVLDTHTHAHK